MSKHQKHVKLAPSLSGDWGRHEWAIIGTTCDQIEALARDIVGQIGHKVNIAYVDASHDTVSDPAVLPFSSLTQCPEEYRLVLHSSQNKYEFSFLLNTFDIILINGNHYKAANQIVIIDPIKEKSLERKIDHLTNVEFVLLTDGYERPYPFLKPKISALTPIVKMSDEKSLAQFLYRSVLEKIPINGLVLSGGKSMRMGFDKSVLPYYGMPQKEHCANLLAAYCKDVFISENESTQDIFPTLSDTFLNFGPLGGILSAFRHDPTSAWLTIAIDMPFINKQSIDLLISKRNMSKVATCFIKSKAEFPEPLFTIWEPKAYQRILNFITLGYSCPRKILINSDVEVVEISDNQILANINEPEDYQRAANIINNLSP